MTTTNSFSSFNDLPLVLNAAQLAGVLNISRANAYNLLHREDFPTLHIGQRMLVSRDKLVQWMDGQPGAVTAAAAGLSESRACGAVRG